MEVSTGTLQLAHVLGFVDEHGSLDDFEEDHVSTEAEVRELWGDEVYPPYVVTLEERRRWDLCHQIATTMSEVNEPSGVANQQFVWFTERHLWASDLPTGDDEPGTQE